jgi:hypothetical protein
LPLAVVLMMLTAAGLGAWLTALAVQYRDVQHAMGFVVQLLMYTAPVVYPASLIPERYEVFGWTIHPRTLYALNDASDAVERSGHRHLLGARDRDDGSAVLPPPRTPVRRRRLSEDVVKERVRRGAVSRSGVRRQNS